MASVRVLLLLSPLALGLPLLGLSAAAGPVLCTTTLEAPSSAGAAPVELTRCDAVQTVPELVERRFFTYTAPYAEGVSIRGQVRDLFGLATGSINRGKAFGAFGFPDQTIVWDGTALENTYTVLLEAQSDLQAWRTGDLSNGFACSLGSPSACPRLNDAKGHAASDRTPVRSLW